MRHPFCISAGEGLGGAGLDRMEDASEPMFGTDDYQARLVNQSERLAIPLASEPTRMGFRAPVLPAGQPLTIAASVLDEQDASILAADARHLPQCVNRIGEGTGR